MSRLYFSKQFDDHSHSARLKPDLHADWRLAGSFFIEKDTGYESGLIFKGWDCGVFLFRDNNGHGIHVSMMGGSTSMGDVHAIIANYGMMNGFGAAHFLQFLPEGDLRGDEALKLLEGVELTMLHERHQAWPWQHPILPARKPLHDNSSTP